MECREQLSALIRCDVSNTAVVTSSYHPILKNIKT